jgi:hypothetical protein
LQRERTAVSLYSSAQSVLRRPQASGLAHRAKAALAGVRAATARITHYAAAIDRTAPDRQSALLRDAEAADRDAAVQNQRLHAVVRRALALAEAHAPPSPSPSTEQAASTAVSAPPEPKRAPPPAPLSEDAQRQYTAALRSYRHADGCYRDLVGDLSRAYGTGSADAERNGELHRRVRTLYAQLRALESTLGAFARGEAHGSSLEQFNLQVHDYLAQCHATRKVVEGSRR